MKLRFFSVLAALFLCASNLSAATPTDITSAAKNFLAALPQEQAGKAKFDWNSDERFNWHFIPKERKGLSIRDMNGAGQDLAFGLLNSALSQRAYLKATTIMSLEQILLETEQGKGPKRDPSNYFVSIFGEPGSKSWGWRFEGHHLAFNFTMAGDELISGSPSFFGTNPHEVRTGPRQGLRVLSREEDLALKLVTSFSDAQKKVAVYTNTAPNDIITGADRKARNLQPEGISMGKLNKEQRAILDELIQEYVVRYHEPSARRDLKTLMAKGADNIHFAWAGPLEKGKGQYYRIQSPEFLIEYDNTQNNANHVHAVVRFLKTDFGGDLLRDHYDADHKK
jgi:hypothetical protein